MKLEIDFKQLDILRRRMRAPLVEWTPDSSQLAPPTVNREKLRDEGIRVEVGDWESSFGELLTLKGEHIVLYIMDARKRGGWEELDQGAERRPKVHLVECHTLRDMEASGRRDRYVASTNPDGMFTVSAAANASSAEHIEKKVKLDPCYNCLMKLDWLGFKKLAHANQREIVESFDFSDFFLEFAALFRKNAKFDERTAPRGGYPANWLNVSRRYREKQGFQCENDSCGVILSDRPRLLHCHHINGVLSDTSVENLKALCALCHSQLPYHSQMYVRPEDKRFIERRRDGRA